MEIRKLKPEERFEANLISTVAFHMKMEDPEKNRQDSLKEPGWTAGSSPTAGSARFQLCRNTGIPGLSGKFSQSCCLKPDGTER